MTKPTDGQACLTKAERIDAAARALFMTNGFRATSMDQIAREADVSKTTLYAYFPSKEALFLAIVEGEKRRFGLKIPEDLPDEAINPRTLLEGIARSLVELVTDPSLLGYFRSVLAESGQSPELGRTIWEAGPKKFLSQVAAFLQKLTDRGYLESDDCQLAANRFLALVRGELYQHCLMDSQFTIERTDIERHVRQCVDFFLAHYEKR